MGLIHAYELMKVPSIWFYQLATFIWLIIIKVANLATFTKNCQTTILMGKKFTKYHQITLYDGLELIHTYLRGLRVQEAPRMPPKKVRKFWCFDPLNGESRRVKPINHKMKYNFQDQTLTEKLNTPPKSMYKGWSNGLCQIPGNFYEARMAKFWYVPM